MYFLLFCVFFFDCGVYKSFPYVLYIAHDGTGSGKSQVGTEVLMGTNPAVSLNEFDVN